MRDGDHDSGHGSDQGSGDSKVSGKQISTSNLEDHRNDTDPANRSIDMETIFSALGDIFTREEFDEEIESVEERFAYLIDKETAALFVAVEKGRYHSEITSLNELADGEFVTVQGTITRIDPMRTFSRKDGTTGRVLSIHISDGIEQVRISFWENREIERIQCGEIESGMMIRIINGKVKINYYGVTINVGNYAVLKVIS